MPGDDTNAYYALSVPACVVAIGAESWLARQKGLPITSLVRAIGSLSGGLGEVMVGLCLGPLLVGLYDWAFRTLAVVHWSDDSLIPWILAFFLGDFCYYLYHRAGHRVGGFWAIHGVHHQSDRFDFTIALRHPWFSDTYSWPFYAPLPLLGVPSTVFFFAISIISFYALLVHTQVWQFNGLGILVTPQSHIVHHCKNPKYIGKNLGAMFCIWDKLLGTHIALDPQDPPQLGTPTGYRSHNGAYAQWVFFEDIWRIAQGMGWKMGLKALIKPPHWRPPQMAAPVPRTARPEGDIPTSLQFYTLFQFILSSILGLEIAWNREHYPLWAQGLGILLVIWGISTIGGLLDGRQSAWWAEIIRVCVTLGVLGGWMLYLHTTPRIFTP